MYTARFTAARFFVASSRASSSARLARFVCSVMAASASSSACVNKGLASSASFCLLAVFFGFGTSAASAAARACARSRTAVRRLFLTSSASVGGALTAFRFFGCSPAPPNSAVASRRFAAVWYACFRDGGLSARARCPFSSLSSALSAASPAISPPSSAPTSFSSSLKSLSAISSDDDDASNSSSTASSAKKSCPQNASSASCSSSLMSEDMRRPRV
mmetsp:Transcript_5511/g.14325  ORF Transcript_5511/g.14325 Transcript_5511/m.14325 type:complete len:217 (-) Transcript_5511:122-772(-)